MPEYTEGVQITNEAVEAMARHQWNTEKFPMCKRWEELTVVQKAPRRFAARSALLTALPHLAPAQHVAELESRLDAVVEAVEPILRAVNGLNTEALLSLGLRQRQITAALAALPTEQPEETDQDGEVLLRLTREEIEALSGRDGYLYEPPDECEHGFRPPEDCPNEGCPDKFLRAAWFKLRAALQEED